MHNVMLSAFWRIRMVKTSPAIMMNLVLRKLRRLLSQWLKALGKRSLSMVLVLFVFKAKLTTWHSKFVAFARGYRKIVVWLDHQSAKTCLSGKTFADKSYSDCCFLSVNFSRQIVCRWRWPLLIDKLSLKLGHCVVSTTQEKKRPSMAFSLLLAKKKIIMMDLVCSDK